MKDIYYNVQHYKDGSSHTMKIGKQYKRALDTAKRMLLNTLVQNVEIVSVDLNDVKKLITALP